MPIRERVDTEDRIRQWTDAIPLHYEYTAGIAGEKFLRGLREGKILAGRCSRCRETALPLRMYCVECYEPVSRHVAVGPSGNVVAITTDKSTGSPQFTWAFVAFKGVRGGLLHRMLGGAKPGDRVTARFKPRKKRIGSVLDIEGFRKVR